jgi:hypothetical protein
MNEIKLVDQSRTQENAVRATSAFEQQTHHAEFTTRARSLWDFPAKM